MGGEAQDLEERGQSLLLARDIPSLYASDLW